VKIGNSERKLGLVEGGGVKKGWGKEGGQAGREKGRERLMGGGGKG